MLSNDARFLAEPLGDDGSGYDAAIAAARPQVVLIDLNLPDQDVLELTQQLHNQASGPHVILFTQARPHADLMDCFTAGAHGCVPEDASLDDLCCAIEKVAAGGIHGIVHSMFHLSAASSEGRHQAHRRDRSSAANLTRRELQIVRLIAEHLSNKQIARRLSVSLYTVKNHVHNIVEKLQVSGRYEAVDLARKRRWLGSANVSSSADRHQ